MDTLVKLIPVAVIAALLAVIVKKDNPIIAVCVSVAAVVLLLTALMPDVVELLEFIKRLGETTSLPGETLLPLIKIVGISIVTGIASQICKDVNEGTLSYIVDLLGLISAILIAAPLFTKVLSILVSIL